MSATFDQKIVFEARHRSIAAGSRGGPNLLMLSAAFFVFLGAIVTVVMGDLVVEKKGK